MGYFAVVLFLFVYFFDIFLNTSLLQSYIHGALEDMRHWYSQHFIRHKHGMNEHTGKREVDERISLQKKQKKVCKAATWKRNLNMSSLTEHCTPLFCICIKKNPKYINVRKLFFCFAFV